jgi:regulator of protease activity HflC (stomatin/prohibitin superfamily)
MQNQRLVRIGVIGFGILVVLLLFGNSMFYTLQPGERGVVFKRFTGGLDKENVKDQGFHVIMPWNKLVIYDVTEQTREETMDILDKKGLSMSIDVTVRFHPVYSKIGFLHEDFMADYINRLVIPEVRSTVRRVMGTYTAAEIYSTKRGEVEAVIVEETEEVLQKNNIVMRALLIRSIKLPQRIKDAIDNKEEQKQIAEAMQYKLQREELEAKRKKIAAEGEATANDIINSSLTENLLRMRGIEATKELIKSENAKVIVIGGGDDGLPLILNGN